MSEYLRQLGTISRDQLILPETQIPQEVSNILQRAERSGIDIFEVYHLSGVTLTQDTRIEGWDEKPDDWYWGQIRNRKISRGAAKLSDVWVLVDKTQKPDYKDGNQLHEKDPFGPLLEQLRKEKKIQSMKGVPKTSRFGISHDELAQIVLPEIAKLLEIESSAVRLPNEIEFNVIGNFKHPEWGKTNTWEWFDDKFVDGGRLIGGGSGLGGLAHVSNWSGFHHDSIAFRPLVVVSPKA